MVSPQGSQKNCMPGGPWQPTRAPNPICPQGHGANKFDHRSPRDGSGLDRLLNRLVGTISSEGSESIDHSGFGKHFFAQLTVTCLQRGGGLVFRPHMGGSNTCRLRIAGNRCRIRVVSQNTEVPDKIPISSTLLVDIHSVTTSTPVLVTLC